MRKVHIVKRLLFYPLRLALLPMGLLIWFIMTDFSNHLDVETFKKCVKDLLRPI